MAKIQTVVIGKDYEDAFFAVCDLYRNGFISPKIISRIDGNIIISGDGNTYFEYDSSNKSYGVDGELKIDKDGASWFKPLRNKETIDSGDNEWIDLLSNVASEYHKNNSYLEFSQIKKELTNGEINRHRGIMNKFFALFYPECQFYPSNQIKTEENDVYGVSIIMDISLVGETQKVLGRLFFKKINDRYFPLTSEEAKEVKVQIDELMVNEKSMESNEEELKEDGIIDDILVELEKAIDNNKFDKSIVYASKKDEEIINSMLQKGPQESVELTCLKLNVLGIFHVKMVSQYYELLFNDTVIFKTIFDKNNDFSISCLNCNSNEYIVENSTIKFNVGDEHYEYYLDANKDNFGFDETTISFIKQNSNISKHGIFISHRFGNKLCNKVSCYSKILSYNNQNYCEDCPFPQVVYTDTNGIKHVMSSLEFAFDKLSLVPIKDEIGEYRIGRCSSCGRFFSKEKLVGKVCPTCRKALLSTNKDENVYAKYKFMLPLRKRLSSNKFAIEDEQMIIFRLKHDLYYFDKLKINENGYMNSPKKEVNKNEK